MIDIDAYAKKLATGQPISEDEIRALLKELAILRDGTAHLASCHVATLESLPKSASKRERSRQIEIVQSAAKILQGDLTAIRYKTRTEHALDRCLKALEEEKQNVQK